MNVNTPNASVDKAKAIADLMKYLSYVIIKTESDISKGEDSKYNSCRNMDRILYNLENYKKSLWELAKKVLPEIESSEENVDIHNIAYYVKDKLGVLLD